MGQTEKNQIDTLTSSGEKTVMSSIEESILLGSDTEKYVLVVDDDQSSRKTLSQMLQRLSFKVLTAKGGKEALQLLNEYTQNTASNAGTVHLLLVDVMMPEMDGIELLRIFKQAVSKEIPVIMVSSSEDPDTISRCFQSGAEDFLSKPIRFEMLKRRVEMCLEDEQRRKKEKIYKEMLKKEREKRDKLTKQMLEQEEELQKIKLQISDTIETPMQVVMKTISDLMAGSYSSEQYKGALIAILKSLGSKDLYKPAFSTLLADKDLDTSTRDWLKGFMSDQVEDKEKPKDSHTLRKSKSSEGVGDFDVGLHVSQTTESKSPISPATDLKVPDIDNFTFNVFDHSHEILIHSMIYMFDTLNLTSTFNINTAKLAVFLNRIKILYHDTIPYHNFTHAMDVTQFVFAICRCSEKIKKLLSPLDQLSLMIAAINHDLEHPGLNNNYQVNAKTKLALLYNDISVLENYHSARTFQVIMEKPCNFLENLSSEDFKDVRKTVISLILATDMSNHFEILTKFQTRIQTGPLSRENKDDRQQFMNVILKCADVSNAARPFHVARKWADLLIEEFCAQGDIEREQGLPISPLMDRTTMDKPRMQVNFIDYIAGPLFKSIGEYIPEMKCLVEVLGNNREEWSTLLPKEPEKVKPIIVDSSFSEVARVKGLSILIVDNDGESRNLFEELFKATGYTCKIVSNLDEASEQVYKSTYDAAIVSCNLNNDDGFTLMRNVRQEKNGDTFPIIAVTDEHKKNLSLKKCEALGICHILVKPFHATTLLKELESLINSYLQNCPPIFLDQALELCGGEEGFVMELLDDFILGGGSQLEEMKEALDSEDYARLQNIAHSMKGAAAQLSAKPVTQAAFGVEKGAKLKVDSSILRDEIGELEKRFKNMEHFVQNLKKEQ